MRVIIKHDRVETLEYDFFTYELIWRKIYGFFATHAHVSFHLATSLPRILSTILFTPFVTRAILLPYKKKVKARLQIRILLFSKCLEDGIGGRMREKTFYLSVRLTCRKWLYIHVHRNQSMSQVQIHSFASCFSLINVHGGTCWQC